MEQRTVTLGGRQYVIQELPLRANAEWRRGFEQTLEPLLGLVEGLHKIQINTAADLAGAIGGMRELLLRSPELMTKLLFDYSPALRADAAWIEDNVYESELLASIGEVLALAYPFGQLVRLVRTLNGAVARTGVTTSPSSASPNGTMPAGSTTQPA